MTKATSTEQQARIHRATSPDGTEIAGPVYGEGPLLVLAHGGGDDGEVSWGGMLPHLTDRFTCYVPSMRGRGWSKDHPDHRPERHAEDLAAFIDSIGEPVGFVGHSTGGTYGLGAIERGAAVDAVALHEPAVFKFWMEGEDAERYQAAIASGAKQAADGQLTDAVRTLLYGVGVHDDEMAAMEEKGLLNQLEQHIPVLLQVLEQAPETEAPSPNEPSELAKVTVPTLLVYGSRACAAHTDGVHYLAEHLDYARVREIPGVGHAAPMLEPELIADELVRFFAEELESA